MERAVRTVEEALRLWGPPIYVRRQIVHNLHVIRDLRRRGAIFVSSEADVPPGARVVFSAHGAPPSAYKRAGERSLRIVDATCPLVGKVHAEARHYAGRGYSIILIGESRHDEVEGTAGEAPAAISIVETVEDAERISPPQTERLAYLTQTTLSVDEAATIAAVLRRRFPGIESPKRDDICYATTNRQRAVKELLDEVDLVLVVGSANSANSNRLVEVARAGGVPGHLIEDENAIEYAWLRRVASVGLTSGASAPESLVRRVIAWFAVHGVTDVRFNGQPENVRFRVPADLDSPSS